MYQLTLSSNVNPRHMREETSIMNRSRINCMLYQDIEMAKHLRTRDQHTPPYISRAKILIRVSMNQCRALHAEMLCDICWPAWMQDHPVDGGNMAEEYARQSESESEARVRLESDEDDGETVLPDSSFGSSFNTRA